MTRFGDWSEERGREDARRWRAKWDAAHPGVEPGWKDQPLWFRIVARLVAPRAAREQADRGEETRRLTEREQR